MNAREFWDAIDAARQVVSSSGGELFDALKLVLERLSAEAVGRIGQQYYVALDKLYTKRHLAALELLRPDGASDDDVRDFFNWIISLGRERFEQTVESPDSLADLLLPDVDPRMWGVEALSVAIYEAYEEKTGRDILEDFPLPSEIAGDFEFRGDGAVEDYFAELPQLAAAMGRIGTKKTRSR